MYYAENTFCAKRLLQCLHYFYGEFLINMTMKFTGKYWVRKKAFLFQGNNSKTWPLSLTFEIEFYFYPILTALTNQLWTSDRNN